MIVARCSTTVSLDVRRSAVVGLLGPIGAGQKQPVLLGIMGLVKPDSGPIILDGDDITDLPMYRRATSASVTCSRKRQ